MFQVRVLGTSAAIPTNSRMPSAQVVTINDRHHLVDCGEGTQMQLLKYRVKFARLGRDFHLPSTRRPYIGIAGIAQLPKPIRTKFPAQAIRTRWFERFARCDIQANPQLSLLRPRILSNRGFFHWRCDLPERAIPGSLTSLSNTEFFVGGFCLKKSTNFANSIFTRQNPSIFPTIFFGFSNREIPLRSTMEGPSNPIRF